MARRGSARAIRRPRRNSVRASSLRFSPSCRRIAASAQCAQMDSSLINAPRDVVRRPSVCPHDCPSVCALEVEVIGGARIGRIHGAEDQRYTAGRRLRQGRALRRAHPSQGSADTSRCGGSARRAPANSSRSPGTTRSTSSRSISSTPSAGSAPKASGRISTAARWASSCATGIERLTHVKRYSRFFGSICVAIAWPGYPRRDGAHGRRRSARNGQVRLHRHLGHQRGRDAGQPDDPRDAGAKGARGENRRHRHLRHRDDAAGGSGAAPQARHGRRAGLRGHARAVPRRLRRSRLSRALRRRAARIGGPSADARSRLGERDHRPQRRIHRSLRGAGRAQRSARSSVSATAFRASATARRTCTRRCASPPSRAPGRTRAAAPFIPTAASSSSTRR